MRTKNPSERELPSTSPSESLQSSSSTLPSPPPPKKPRTTKHHPKVQSVAPPSPPPVTRSKARGVVIREPSEVPRQVKTPTKATGHREKGKEKMKEREADWQARMREERTEFLLQRLQSRSNLGNPPTGHRFNPNLSASASLLEVTQSLSPPPDFISSALSLPENDRLNFKAQYGDRSFCPTVCVHLSKLRDECSIDLSPWLKPFEPLLALRTAYCPSVVRHFYFYMRNANILDSEGNIIEEKLETVIRKKKVILTADIINSILGITEVPTVSEHHLSDEEIFKILRPGLPLGPLNFKPADMPPIHRVIWYIYSRNLVQKGKNFTHFTFRDYPLMASIMAKEPQNIGQWVLDEMRNFRFGSHSKATIPFPNLISLILFHNKIWFLEGTEKIVKPPLFGQSHLNRMKISFREGSGQSKAPSKTRQSPTQGTEAQSSPAATATPSASTQAPPSMFGASLQPLLEKVVKQAVDGLSISMVASFHQLISDLEVQIGVLVGEINTNYNKLLETQDEHTRRLQSIAATQALHTQRFQRLEAIFGIPDPDLAGPSATSPTPVPSPTEPLHPTPSPSQPVPNPEPTFHHIISSSSSSSTATAPGPSITSIVTPPPQPSTAIVVYTPPPAPIQCAPPSDLTFPTFLPDDKGGEK